MSKIVVGIAGTTSVGKSAVGVELAQMLNSEIVSADSMQVYKGMDIGTAKITCNEMCGIKHHMIDIVEPNVNYSSFLYQQQASKIIDNMASVPIVVGGTGFYFDSLLYPPEFGGCFDEERRAELKRLFEEKGIEPLQDLLKELDGDSFKTIDVNNVKRVIRAIEIAENGNKRVAGVGRNIEPRYNMKLFVLERERAHLYDQIDTRVDKMISVGLVDEVKRLIELYGVCDTSAFQAIGYKEIVEYLNGSISLDDAIDKIKLNTRHYAKRQLTYFKKMNVLAYIDVEGKTVNEIARQIKDMMIRR